MPSTDITLSITSCLDVIVQRLPGSFWWVDQSRHGITSYWLRIPSANHQNGVEKFLSSLKVLRYGDRYPIEDIWLFPTNAQQRIFIETVPPNTIGHWKVLWADQNDPVQLSLPNKACDTHKVTNVNNTPVQLGPGVHLNGWVSGHSYSAPTNQPGSITYSWCFLVPVPIDRLAHATILLLPPANSTTTPDRISRPTTQHGPPTRTSNKLSNLSRLRLANCDRQGREIQTRVILSASSNQPRERCRRADFKQRVEQKRSHHRRGGVKDPFHLLPVLLLLEPNSRLVMLVDEYTTTSTSRRRQTRSLSYEEFDRPLRSPQLKTVESHSIQHSNVYTHIHTQTGQPAYINGASLSPLPYDDDVPPRVRSSGTPGGHGLVIYPSDDEEFRPIAHTPRSAFRDPSSSPPGVSEASSPVLHQTSKTFMLKQLEVLSTSDTIPPPWMLKVNDQNPLKYPSSEKSWSTLDTQLSLRSDGPMMGERSHPEDAHFMNSDTVSDSDRSGSEIILDQSQSESSLSQSATTPRRSSIFEEVLAELNAFAEDVLTKKETTESSSPSVQHQRSDRCKVILRKLSMLCDDEEEEDDVQEVRPASKGSQSLHIKDAVEAIQNPLPVSCRVPSPVRLLVCYFEILSELDEFLRDRDRSLLPRQKQWSNLVDLSAALLRMINVPDSKDQGHDPGGEESTCSFGLHVLTSLRDVILMSPVTWHQCLRVNTSVAKTDEHKRVLRVYMHRIEATLEEHRSWFANLARHELSSERTTPLSIEQAAQVYATKLGALHTELITNLARPVAKGSETNGSMGQTKRTPVPISSADEWDCLISWCIRQSQLLKQYLTEPWFPVMHWQRDITESSNLKNLIDWCQSEVDEWHKCEQFLKDQFVTITQLADHIQFTAPERCSSPILAQLLEELHGLVDQALDRATQINFFRQICTLPNGLLSLIQYMQELEQQINSFTLVGSDGPTRTELEIHIRQLQHRLCIECAFLTKLSALTSRSIPPEGSERNPVQQDPCWFSAWTSRVSETYQSLVRNWDNRLTSQYREVMCQAFKLWCKVAQDCLEAISTSVKPYTPDNLLLDCNHFPSLWCLLCDADLLYETLWHLENSFSSEADGDWVKTVIPKEMFTHMHELSKHVEFVVTACRGKATLIPTLLQRLEESLCDARTEPVLFLINVAVNGEYTKEFKVDRLRNLVYRLGDCQRYWDRRLQLTQRALNLVGAPEYGNSELVQRWSSSLCLKRDWLVKVLGGLQRIRRASELVEAERFPLRPISTFEVHFVREEILRQEQTFLEALRFGLDVLHTEATLVTEGLSVYDPQTSRSNSLCATLEELKHLFSRMLHDPRLGQSSTVNMPRDKFTNHIQTQLQEADKLYETVSLIVRSDWELAANSAQYRIQDGFLPGKDVERSMKKTEKRLHTLMVKRLELLVEEWKEWKTKCTPFKLSPYTAGFSWTPISFSTSHMQGLFKQEVSLDSLLTLAEEQEGCLRIQLEALQHPPMDARPKTPCVPKVPNTLQEQSCSCPPIGSNLDEPDTQLQHLDATDLIEIEKVLYSLFSMQPRLDSEDPKVDRWEALHRRVLEILQSFWQSTFSDLDQQTRMEEYFQSRKKLLSQPLMDLSPEGNGTVTESLKQWDKILLDLKVLDTMLSTLQDALNTVPHDVCTTQRSWLDGLRPTWERVRTELLSERQLCSHNSQHAIADLVRDVEYNLNLATKLLPIDPDFGEDKLQQACRSLELACWLLQEDSKEPHQDVSTNIKRLCQKIDDWNDLLHCYQALNSLFEEVVTSDDIQPAGLEVTLVKLNVLEAHLDEISSNQLNDGSSGSELVQLLPSKQIQLVRQILLHRLNYHEFLVSAPIRRHQRLNHSLLEVDNCLDIIVHQLRSILDTRNLEAPAMQTPALTYALSMRLPNDKVIAQLFAQLAFLDRHCEEVRNNLSEKPLSYPLDLRELRRMEQDHADDGTVDYVRGLMRQIATSLLDRTQIGEYAKALGEWSEKLHELVRALSQHVGEISDAQKQLRSALPNLTDLYMDELAEAVSILEVRADADRTDQPGSHSTTHGRLAQHIKNAGRRLMELETGLEHSSECTRVLLLLARGKKHWTSHSEGQKKHSVEDRRTGLREDYESSFVCHQLRSAWSRLAQLGDRLGRIQAGLPARSLINDSMGASSFGGIRVEATPEAVRNRSQLTPSPLEPPTHLNAEEVRRKRLNLRDLLGSHSCVYPECKRAREEWVPCHTAISKEQISIDTQVREVFIQLVHFYARLRKDLIENRDRSIEPDAKSSSSVDSIIRAKWHRNTELVECYGDLMEQVGRLSDCELPQVVKLKAKAKSLEQLWGQPRLESPHRGLHRWPAAESELLEGRDRMDVMNSNAVDGFNGRGLSCTPGSSLELETHPGDEYGSQRLLNGPPSDWPTATSQLERHDYDTASESTGEPAEQTANTEVDQTSITTQKAEEMRTHPHPSVDLEGPTLPSKTNGSKAPNNVPIPAIATPVSLLNTAREAQLMKTYAAKHKRDKRRQRKQRNVASKEKSKKEQNGHEAPVLPQVDNQEVPSSHNGTTMKPFISTQEVHIETLSEIPPSTYEFAQITPSTDSSAFEDSTKPTEETELSSPSSPNVAQAEVCNDHDNSFKPQTPPLPVRPVEVPKVQNGPDNEVHSRKFQQPIRSLFPEPLASSTPASRIPSGQEALGAPVDGLCMRLVPRPVVLNGIEENVVQYNGESIQDNRSLPPKTGTKNSVARGKPEKSDKVSSDNQYNPEAVRNSPLGEMKTESSMSSEMSPDFTLQITAKTEENDSDWLTVQQKRTKRGKKSRKRHGKVEKGRKEQLLLSDIRTKPQVSETLKPDLTAASSEVTEAELMDVDDRHLDRRLKLQEPARHQSGLNGALHSPSGDTSPDKNGETSHFSPVTEARDQQSWRILNEPKSSLEKVPESTDVTHGNFAPHLKLQEPIRPQNDRRDLLEVQLREIAHGKNGKTGPSPLVTKADGQRSWSFLDEPKAFSENRPESELTVVDERLCEPHLKLNDPTRLWNDQRGVFQIPVGDNPHSQTGEIDHSPMVTNVSDQRSWSIIDEPKVTFSLEKPSAENEFLPANSADVALSIKREDKQLSLLSVLDSASQQIAQQFELELDTFQGRMLAEPQKLQLVANPAILHPNGGSGSFVHDSQSELGKVYTGKDSPTVSWTTAPCLDGPADLGNNTGKTPPMPFLNGIVVPSVGNGDIILNGGVDKVTAEENFIRSPSLEKRLPVKVEPSVPELSAQQNVPRKLRKAKRRLPKPKIENLAQQQLPTSDAPSVPASCDTQVPPIFSQMPISSTNRSSFHGPHNDFVPLESTNLGQFSGSEFVSVQLAGLDASWNGAPLWNHFNSPIASTGHSKQDDQERGQLLETIEVSRPEDCQASRVVPLTSRTESDLVDVTSKLSTAVQPTLVSDYLQRSPELETKPSTKAHSHPDNNSYQRPAVSATDQIERSEESNRLWRRSLSFSESAPKSIFEQHLQQDATSITGSVSSAFDTVAGTSPATLPSYTTSESTTDDLFQPRSSEHIETSRKITNVPLCKSGPTEVPIKEVSELRVPLTPTSLTHQHTRVNEASSLTTDTIEYALSGAEKAVVHDTSSVEPQKSFNQEWDIPSAGSHPQLSEKDLEVPAQDPSSSSLFLEHGKESWPVPALEETHSPTRMDHNGLPQQQHENQWSRTLKPFPQSTTSKVEQIPSSPAAPTSVELPEPVGSGRPMTVQTSRQKLSDNTVSGSQLWFPENAPRDQAEAAVERVTNTRYSHPSNRNGLTKPLQSAESDIRIDRTQLSVPCAPTIQDMKRNGSELDDILPCFTAPELPTKTSDELIELEDNTKKVHRTSPRRQDFTSESLFQSTHRPESHVGPIPSVSIPPSPLTYLPVEELSCVSGSLDQKVGDPCVNNESLYATCSEQSLADATVSNESNSVEASDQTLQSPIGKTFIETSGNWSLPRTDNLVCSDRSELLTSKDRFKLDDLETDIDRTIVPTTMSTSASVADTSRDFVPTTMATRLPLAESNHELLQTTSDSRFQPLYPSGPIFSRHDEEPRRSTPFKEDEPVSSSIKWKPVLPAPTSLKEIDRSRNVLSGMPSKPQLEEVPLNGLDSANRTTPVNGWGPRPKELSYLDDGEAPTVDSNLTDAHPSPTSSSQRIHVVSTTLESKSTALPPLTDQSGPGVTPLPVRSLYSSNDRKFGTLSRTEESENRAIDQTNKHLPTMYPAEQTRQTPRPQLTSISHKADATTQTHPAARWESIRIVQDRTVGTAPEDKYTQFVSKEFLRSTSVEEASQQSRVASEKSSQTEIDLRFRLSRSGQETRSRRMRALAPGFTEVHGDFSSRRKGSGTTGFPKNDLPCCRYLLPFLATLLLLLFLLIWLCLHRIPHCGTFFSRSYCIEDTVFWRYIYHPLHTFRFRRPPV